MISHTRPRGTPSEAFLRRPNAHAPRNPRKTLAEILQNIAEPLWSPPRNRPVHRWDSGGTLAEPSWNPRRTLRNPAEPCLRAAPYRPGACRGAETPSLSAVGKNRPFGTHRRRHDRSIARDERLTSWKVWAANQHCEWLQAAQARLAPMDLGGDRFHVGVL